MSTRMMGTRLYAAMAGVALAALASQAVAQATPTGIVGPPCVADSGTRTSPIVRSATPTTAVPITIDEILTAVNHALTGCAAAPTFTPTATAGVMTSTPTKTTTIPPATSPPVASPTQTPTLTATAVASPTPTRTATVALTSTATPTPPLQASATATRTPTGAIAHYCSDIADQIDIPDDEPFGVASVLVINESLQINRLKISVRIEHSWVGDLVVTLTRLSDLRTVTLVDRPGYPASMFGCGEADILCQFADESTVPAETQCRPDLAALQGLLQPAEPLAVFSGGDLAGTWQLAVADLSAISTGRLMQWCIDAY